MSHVDGEDDESTDNEIEDKTDHKMKEPHIIAGEDSEEDDTPVPTPDMGSDKMGMPHLALGGTKLAGEEGTPKPDDKTSAFRGSFQPTDPSKIKQTPVIRDLKAKNRKFYARVPGVVASKLQGVDEALKETGRLVQQTLNTLQDIPIYAKLGMNDATKLCDLIDHSLALVPKMK
uniref:Biogenesis of lysosome-related organelles complex 1 subunit 3 n=1 Tax=Lotharella oceanica TaxID=641309 RepID=A0A7S2TTR7_9EUKA